MNDLKKQLSDILCKQVEVLAKKSKSCKPEQLVLINAEIRDTIRFILSIGC